VFDVAALITTGPSKVDKGGAFPKEFRAKEIEARRHGRAFPKNKTTGEPAASVLELLTELAALEIERLDPTQVTARDNKGKPTTPIAELAKKPSDLKGGKARLKRLTGFDGEQKSRYFTAGLKWRKLNQTSRVQTRVSYLVD
jgi:hypothetical protein